jgi:hypothetical protein
MMIFFYFLCQSSRIFFGTNQQLVVGLDGDGERGHLGGGGRALLVLRFDPRHVDQRGRVAVLVPFEVVAHLGQIFLNFSSEKWGKNDVFYSNNCWSYIVLLYKIPT